MFKKYALSLYVLSLFTVFSVYSAGEVHSKRAVRDYVSSAEYKTFEDFCRDLKKKVATLSKNGKACLLNLLDSQFYLFDLMEQELTKGNANQEKIESMMAGFQKALESFEAQCDEATKELYADIQKNIALLVPQEVAGSIQQLQDEMQKRYTSAKEKNKLNSEDFQKDFTILQNDLMSKLLEIQAITSLASIEVYKIVYDIVEQTNKDLLVRRFDVNGIIPLTKRKKNVTHPNKAYELIAAFLDQATSLREGQQEN